MVLEAIEDSLRGPLGEGQPCPRNLYVEHVMPQSWQEHWGGDIAEDPVAALRRDGHVQVLKQPHPRHPGSWADDVEPAVDRPEAAARSWAAMGARLSPPPQPTQLNAEIVAEHQNLWTEDDIRARTDTLIARVISVGADQLSACSRPGR